MKKISVCVPTYNGEQYLSDCLESILAQTFTDTEILIVDDHSQDKTLDIIKAYACQDQRIRYYQNPTNLGLVENWNRCLELAQGEWIKFVFQDDTITRDCLGKMLAVSNPDIGIVYCKRKFIFETGISPKIPKNYLNRLAQVNQIFSGYSYISASKYCQAVLDYINYPGFNLIGEPTTVMLHQSIPLKFGKFNPQMIQTSDEEYWTRIAINQGLIYVEEELATFRIHSTSTSMKNLQQKFYRLAMIDPLIRLYNITFNSIYEPLRQFAAQDYPQNVNFRELLQRQAYKSCLKARLHPNRTLMQEWQKVVQDYPLLANFVNNHYLLVKEIPSYLKEKFFNLFP